MCADGFLLFIMRVLPGGGTRSKGRKLKTGVFDNQAYIVQMDKRFCTEGNPVTGEKYLAIRTPVFGPQQVLSIKYLKVNDNTRIGLIAYYSADAGRLHSYVSL